MEKLLPCPFCGAKAEIMVYDPEESWDYRMEVEHDESCWLASSRPSVRNYYTKAEAIDAWNTRTKCESVFVTGTATYTEPVSYVQERTCHLERHGSIADWPEMVCWSCSECNFGWHHDINDKQFSYCPNCGARVVD